MTVNATCPECGEHLRAIGTYAVLGQMVTWLACDTCGLSWSEDELDAIYAEREQAAADAGEGEWLCNYPAIAPEMRCTPADPHEGGFCEWVDAPEPTDLTSRVMVAQADKGGNSATWTTSEVCNKTGATKRQLIFWVDRGYLTPRRRTQGSTGPGNPFEWSNVDVATINRAMHRQGWGLTVEASFRMVDPPCVTYGCNTVTVPKAEWDALVDAVAADQRPDNFFFAHAVQRAARALVKAARR